MFGDVALDLVCADSFTFTPAAPCPLICEHTFPCILPRKLRADWGRRVTKLLPPGGLLAGYLFLGDQLKGPPLGIVPGQLDELLGPNFGRIEDAAGRLDPAIFRPRALGGVAATVTSRRLSQILRLLVTALANTLAKAIFSAHPPSLARQKER